MGYTVLPIEFIYIAYGTILNTYDTSPKHLHCIICALCFLLLKEGNVKSL